MFHVRRSLHDGPPAAPRGRGVLAHDRDAAAESVPALPAWHIRDEQGESSDAISLLREAVRLDPDYRSAWQQIEYLAGRMHRPAPEHDDATLNLIRLDPLDRQGTPDVAEVRNLRALWAAVEKAAAVKSSEPREMYPLAASAAELAKDREDAAEGDAEEDEPVDDEEDDEYVRADTPGEAIGQTNIILRSRTSFRTRTIDPSARIRLLSEAYPLASAVCCASRAMRLAQHIRRRQRTGLDAAGDLVHEGFEAAVGLRGDRAGPRGRPCRLARARLTDFELYAARRRRRRRGR